MYETDTGAGTGMMPRATIAQICAQRRQALEMFDQAFAALAAADGAIKAARSVVKAAAPTQNRFSYIVKDAEKFFFDGLKLPDPETYRAEARRLVDVSVWAHIIAVTDLQRIMDKTARDEMHRSLTDEPPEVTEENVLATIQHLMGEAETIFRRGIARCFSELDRRFRSHDGWKIGSRVILDHAFNDMGYWNHYNDRQAYIRDIERTFLTLDGKPHGADYAGVAGMIDTSRRSGWGARQSECDTDYFKVRIFKNGNAHLWFKRDDLVVKVNKLLAEYYGEVIPEERAPDPHTGFRDPKTTPAKRFGFFPTPEAAVQQVFNRSPFYRREDEPALTVLEPSAGTGSLAAEAVKQGAVVDCVELQSELVHQLRAAGIYRRVVQGDFLTMLPDPDRLYDRVVMNPPFDLERDIDHVLHAMKFLKPDGHLTAIVSAGTEFRETRKATAFRALMEQMHAEWQDLPAGSFASVGTYVNTRIVHVWMDRRRRRW